MPRKGHVKKRQSLPDTRYGSAALAKFINSLMRKGKKSVAERIMYNALDIAGEKLQTEPFEVFKKAMEKGIVTLHGYTDHLGSPSYNLAIAEQRVNAVATALRRNGIAATQIRRNAVGSERVPAACRSVQCRRLMRRVELVFGE